MKGRTEVKRIITKKDTVAVRRILYRTGFMPDQNYQVMSLYFDDSDISSFYDHTNGTNYRDKYRLRAYRDSRGNLQKTMFFERKIKRGSIGAKERIEIEGAPKGIVSAKTGDVEVLCQVAAELHWPAKFATCPSGMAPRAFISYDRQRFTNSRQATEVTLDTNINATGVSKLNSRMRSVHADFYVVEEKCEQGQYSNRELAERLNEKAYPTAFSKYIWALQEIFPNAIV